MLDSMEVTGVDRVPFGPDVSILPQCSISSAGNITEDPVKLDSSLFIRIAGVRNHEVGHDGGVMVGHDDARRLESLDLVSQHVTSGVVRVIGNHQPCG